MQAKGLVETTVIKKRHIELCKAIQGISSARKMSFINTTKSVKEAASKKFVHGPIDWDHFNKRGYQVLSDDLAEIFLQPVEDTRTDACVY